MSLENSAKVLARSLANGTVKVVRHKYGEQAGVVVDDALYSGLNIGVTAWNVDNMGLKAIAKRSAKSAGLQLLSDLNKPNDNSSEVPSAENISAPKPLPRKKK